MPGCSYLVDPKTREKFAVNGVQRSTDPLDCQPFCNYVKYTEDQLPKIADLRPYMPDVENQRQTLTCVANSLAGAYEYLLRRGANDPTEMSRLFIYYNGRARDPVLGQNLAADNGCQITHAVDSLKEYGTCAEDNWPFREEAIPLKPRDENYQEAQNYTILEYNNVPLVLYKMKACLAQGFPFVFGMKLFTSFGQASTNGGFVPMPSANEAAATKHKLHAMLAVGYIEEKQQFIVRNSWGAEWGDRGYLYIPYAYMTDPNLVFDAFVVKKFSNIEIGTEHWKENLSEIQYGEPNAFGASFGGSNDDEWTFEDSNEGENQASGAFASNADNSGDNNWSFQELDDDAN